MGRRLPRAMHHQFGRLHSDIVKSYEVTASNGPVMSIAEATEVSRLAKLYNRLIWKSLRLMRSVDHPTLEVVSEVAGRGQLGLQWRPFLGKDGRLSSNRLREITL